MSRVQGCRTENGKCRLLFVSSKNKLVKVYSYQQWKNNKNTAIDVSTDVKNIKQQDSELRHVVMLRAKNPFRMDVIKHLRK